MPPAAMRFVCLRGNSPFGIPSPPSDFIGKSHVPRYMQNQLRRLMRLPRVRSCPWNDPKVKKPPLQGSWQTAPQWHDKQNRAGSRNCESARFVMRCNTGSEIPAQSPDSRSRRSAKSRIPCSALPFSAPRSRSTFPSFSGLCWEADGPNQPPAHS